MGCQKGVFLCFLNVVGFLTVGNRYCSNWPFLMYLKQSGNNGVKLSFFNCFDLALISASRHWSNLSCVFLLSFTNSAFASFFDRVGHARSTSKGHGFESDYAKLPTVAKQASLWAARTSAKNQGQLPYSNCCTCFVQFAILRSPVWGSTRRADETQYNQKCRSQDTK